VSFRSLFDEHHLFAGWLSPLRALSSGNIAARAVAASAAMDGVTAMQYGDLLSQVLDFSAAGSKAQTECGLNSFLRSEVALLNNIVDSNFRNHKLGSAEQKSGLVNIQNFAAFLNTDEAKKKSEVPGLKSHNQALFSFLRKNHTILKSDEMTCSPPAAK